MSRLPLVSLKVYYCCRCCCTLYFVFIYGLRSWCKSKLMRINSFTVGCSEKRLWKVKVVTRKNKDSLCFLSRKGMKIFTNYQCYSFGRCKALLAAMWSPCGLLDELLLLPVLFYLVANRLRSCRLLLITKQEKPWIRGRNCFHLFGVQFVISLVTFSAVLGPLFT